MKVATILLVAVFALFSVTKAEAEFVLVDPLVVESNNPSNWGWLYYEDGGEGSIGIFADFYSFGEIPQTGTITAVRQPFDAVFIGGFEEGLQGIPVHVYRPTMDQTWWTPIPGAGPLDVVAQDVIAVTEPGNHIIEITYEGALYHTFLRFEFPIGEP